MFIYITVWPLLLGKLIEPFCPFALHHMHYEFSSELYSLWSLSVYVESQQWRFVVTLMMLPQKRRRRRRKKTMKEQEEGVKNPPTSARDLRYGFNPWVGKIRWRTAQQSTPVVLPGESRGQRSPAGYGS